MAITNTQRIEPTEGDKAALRSSTALPAPNSAADMRSANRSRSDREAPALMTDKEVAGYLRICRSSIWRNLKLKRFPAPIKIGGATRWRRADIEALVAAPETEAA